MKKCDDHQINSQFLEKQTFRINLTLMHIFIDFNYLLMHIINYLKTSLINDIIF